MSISKEYLTKYQKKQKTVGHNKGTKSIKRNCSGGKCGVRTNVYCEECKEFLCKKQICVRTF